MPGLLFSLPLNFSPNTRSSLFWRASRQAWRARARAVATYLSDSYLGLVSSNASSNVTYTLWAGAGIKRDLSGTLRIAPRE